jgi:hypothetical protein
MAGAVRVCRESDLPPDGGMLAFVRVPWRALAARRGPNEARCVRGANDDAAYRRARARQP